MWFHIAPVARRLHADDIVHLRSETKKRTLELLKHGHTFPINIKPFNLHRKLSLWKTSAGKYGERTPQQWPLKATDVTKIKATRTPQIITLNFNLNASAFILLHMTQISPGPALSAPWTVEALSQNQNKWSTAPQPKVLNSVSGNNHPTSCNVVVW